jgi:hypothetical protein
MPPAFQAGHAGSIPVARSNLMAFFDFVFPMSAIQGFYRAASLPHAMFLQLNCNPRT